jgi:trk system potassium uptake protein TrkH
MALLSLPVCLLAGETYAVPALLATAAPALLAGQVLYRSHRHAYGQAQVRTAMVAAVATWLLIPLICALPLLLIAQALPAESAAAALGQVANAVFEAISGFTSTGLSMVERPGELPHIVQWWRSLMQWVGGVGVIVLMLTVFHPAGDAHRLYFAEARVEVFAKDIAATVRDIWWIYGAYTLLAAGLLAASGMTWWQALNYGMAGIATGGFGITDQSLGDFGAAARVVMILTMLLGAISFGTHYRILAEREVKLLWQRVENVVLLALAVSGALLLALENRWYLGEFAWLDSAFQLVSALTTTGFSTVAIAEWSPSALLLLVLAMICGGVAGSTTGGLKLNRVVLLGEAIYARVHGIIRQPWRLLLHRRITAEDEEPHAVRLLEAAAVMLSLWVLTLAFGTIVLLHFVPPGTLFEHALLEVASALGNVGLSSGITSPDLPLGGKLTLMVIMWLGRLEIVPVLVLFGALISPPHRRQES